MSATSVGTLVIPTWLFEQLRNRGYTVRQIGLMELGA